MASEAQELSNKAWKQRNPDRVRATQRRQKLRQRYGLTEAQFDLMLVDQGGVCAICSSTSPGSGQRNWHVDHDHSCCPTEKTCGACIRGILCHKCNSMLGNASDSVAVLAKAIEYLS